VGSPGTICRALPWTGGYLIVTAGEYRDATAGQFAGSATTAGTGTLLDVEAGPSGVTTPELEVPVHAAVRRATSAALLRFMTPRIDWA
jgi:hypothetical protein